MPIRNAAFGVIGAEPDVTRYAYQYFDIRVWSAPATLFNFVALGWLLGMQNARGPLAITLVLNLTNVALDLWFVLGLGLKVRGVAAGALLAEFAGAAAAVWLLRRELRRHPGSWSGTRLLDLQSYRALLRINGNLFIRTLALMFTFAFVTVQGARMGSVFLAANALLMNFQWLTAYALDGIANAAEALVGKAVGARDRDGMLRAVRRTLAWSLGFGALFSLVFWLAGPAIVRTLTSLPDDPRHGARVPALDDPSAADLGVELLLRRRLRGRHPEPGDARGDDHHRLPRLRSRLVLHAGSRQPRPVAGLHGLHGAARARHAPVVQSTQGDAGRMADTA